jgi:hypothetical protein
MLWKDLVAHLLFIMEWNWIFYFFLIFHPVVLCFIVLYSYLGWFHFSFLVFSILFLPFP